MTQEYTFKQQELFYSRPLKVICIGAGLSGIFLGIRLPMLARNIELVIYEKNPEVGGTWFENKYPGAACDVPSHRYQYTFEPNPNWSQFYSPAAEIQHYLYNVAIKYDVMKYIQLNTRVTGAWWNEDKGKWNLKIRNSSGREQTDSCDILINAMGVLNDWKWPSINGINTYQGHLMHTANWDNNVSLKNLNIAVIGNGSSGIQLLPAILDDCKHIDNYVRSNTWVLPRLGAEHIKKTPDGKYVYEYSEEERKRFAEDPEYFLAYRRKLEADVSAAFRLFIRDHPTQKKVFREVKKHMAELLSEKPEIAEKLIPDWPVGCRRLTPGVGYLESLVNDKVDTYFSNISHIDETGIVTTDGKHKKYDAIACATGFNVSYSARFPFVGRKEKQLDEKYGESPYSYLAIAIPGFPNYFCFNGPNAPVGAGSLIPATEAQGEYIVKAILKFQRQDIKSMCPRENATAQFVKHTDSFMPSTVWSAGCRSWYKNGKVDGRVTALWPGTGLHYIDTLSEPRWEDFDYTYQDINMFSYLGDGFTHIEHTGEDRTWDLDARTRRMENHPAILKQKKVNSTSDRNDDETARNVSPSTTAISVM